LYLEYPPPSLLSQYSSLSSNGDVSRSPTPYSNVIENDCSNELSSRRDIQSMRVRSKFGSLGPQKGQFNAPHGFCLGIDEEIIVADTNNHRIQIFDKKCLYKSQFGIPGREDGQLWYPRKVAVIRQNGIFVICDRGNERSRMQIFTPNGDFIQKISIRYIDILAGLAITQQG
jgi:tripartite motif-containing protein 2/3